MRPGRGRALRAALALFLAAPLCAAASPSTKPLARAAQEAQFMRSVDAQRTANFVTGDLSHYTGTHVAYDCEVETIVRRDVILGQCGADDEPVDLFVRLSTAHVRTGDHLHVLGIMEPPATWSDVMGHTVYYAFLRAVFVDSISETSAR